MGLLEILIIILIIAYLGGLGFGVGGSLIHLLLVVVVVVIIIRLLQGRNAI